VHSTLSSTARSRNRNMAEGTTAATSSASASARRKPRRKRNAGKKNESSSQKGGKGGSSKSGNKKSGGSSSSNNNNNNNNNNNTPPPPPQVKITIRNIQNADKYGSVESVLEELVSKLMESCVEKKANNQYTIELDRTAVRYLITEEEKIKEQHAKMVREREEEKNQKNEGEDSKETVDGNEDGDDENENGKTEEKKEEIQKEEDAKDDTVVEGTGKTKNNSSDRLDVILAPKTASSLPTIVARPLYVVPPRKTRRRGERGGTAYVLLIGPKIEQKKTLTATLNKTEEKDQPVRDSPSEPQFDEHEKPIEVAAVTDDESGAITVKTAAAAVEGGDTSITKATSVTSEKTISYPRELAKGRLLLSNTIKSLTELVVADAMTQESDFSGCIVEQSMNGKTWKMFHNSNSRPDRRDGTIEGTADYKEWLENISKQKEELKARPKPAPGGGIIAATTTNAAGDDAEEDGQPVSSLVQNLRAKKQDAKRKKTQKKKKKEDSGKAGKTKAEVSQSENGKKKKKRNEKKNRSKILGDKKTDATVAAAAAKKAKRKKRERAKKKEKAKAAKVGASPTTLLKPQSAST